MKTYSRNHRNPSDLLLALILAVAAACSVQAQNSAFTYQGRLDAAGQPASGNFDLRLTLYSVPAAGGALPGTTITNVNVAVSNGLFTTTIDYGAGAGGGAFDGGPRWMEIGVRSNAVGGAFSILAPRQRITSTPYAIRADYLSGSVSDGQLPANIARLDRQQIFPEVTYLTNRLNQFAGQFTGNGAGLTNLSNLDAADITQGTLPNARLSADMARRSGAQAFTGINTFSNTVKIADNDVLEFGAGLAKEVSAGKIGYGAFTPNTLDIVGGGTNVSSRSVRIYAERDTQFMGPVRMQDNDAIYLRGNTDNAHGIGYCGAATPFAGVGLDGPVVFGYTGGGLGVRRGTNETIVLSWSNNGNTAIRGGLTVSSNVEAAMLILTGGADLSEGFGLTDEAQPGMVVCIDPENPGKVKTSQRAYDRTVAGIISGAGGVNTGMMMSQKGSVAHGDHPVALTGRVYCWADASAGAIQPGDLLTSAEVPGHAMKVTDHSRAPGSVLGKAMTGLKEGKGLVLVLVNLQ